MYIWPYEHGTQKSLERNRSVFRKTGFMNRSRFSHPFQYFMPHILTITSQRLSSSAEVITLSKRHEQFAHTITVGLQHIFSKTIRHINARINSHT
jgi:hypothetical protein